MPVPDAVGFDMPVRRLASARLMLDPISGMMRARDACFRRACELFTMPPRRLNLLSKGSTSRRVDVLPVGCLPCMSAAP